MRGWCEVPKESEMIQKTIKVTSENASHGWIIINYCKMLLVIDFRMCIWWIEWDDDLSQHPLKDRKGDIWTFYFTSLVGNATLNRCMLVCFMEFRVECKVIIKIILKSVGNVKIDLNANEFDKIFSFKLLSIFLLQLKQFNDFPHNQRQCVLKFCDQCFNASWFSNDQRFNVLGILDKEIKHAFFEMKAISRMTSLRFTQVLIRI